MRAHYVRSPAAPAPPRTIATAQVPEMVRRPAWGASESRRDPIEYASSLRLAVVHHTAGSNSYSRAEAPAIVRGIQTYHVRGNGWNDIGYNFLVDRYGQVYEGRAGGITRNVIGAHAGGFNDGTVGVAVIGSYSSGRISAAAQAAVSRLIAWRLDVAHVDPLALPTYVSNGNARYPKGTPVIMRGVVGHRETGFTSCPGDALMGQLAALARGAWTAGLPKVFDPRVRGSIGGSVRLTARLSSRASVDGDRHRLGAERGRLGDGHRRRGRLDVGLERRRAGRVHLGDRDAGSPLGDGDAAHAHRADALRSRSSGPRRPPSRPTPTGATTRPRSRTSSAPVRR